MKLLAPYSNYNSGGSDYGGYGAGGGYGGAPSGGANSTPGYGQGSFDQPPPQTGWGGSGGDSYGQAQNKGRYSKLVS